jgi:hypothetical protein
MKLKICTSCKEEKGLSLFRRDKHTKDGYQPRCKECARAQIKSDYTLKYKAKSDIRNKERSDRYKQITEKVRATGCVCCGEKELCCLDLHHRDPSEKEFTISQYRTIAVERLLEEIKKCIVVCKNCHAKIHAGLIVLES